MENTIKKKSSFFQVVLAKLKQLGKFIVDDCIKLPAYILAHPLKGFEEFKRYKKGKKVSFYHEERNDRKEFTIVKYSKVGDNDYIMVEEITDVDMVGILQKTIQNS